MASNTKSGVWLFYGLLIHSVISKLTAMPSNGDLRLAGYGATHLWGRLEIYLGGRWGTICDDSFTIKETEVACRQMGLGYAVNYRASPLQRHGLANSANHLILACNGDETHILNCNQIQITNLNICTHLEDVEIICSDWKPWPYSGEIRLVGGTSVSEGYVEMYLNGEWGRVCSDSMSSDEANVICRQLGYDSAVSYTPSSIGSMLNMSKVDLARNTIWFNGSLNCTGNEVCLTSCFSSIPTSPLTLCSNEVGVRCTHDATRRVNINVGSKSVCEVNSTLHDKSLRLVGGDAPHIGRLEVLHNNEWGVICFDEFGAAEGHVACRQLGYSVIYDYASVSINDTPMVHFYGVRCRGTEFGLIDCDLIELTNRTCGARGFVSIHCYDSPYPPLASVRMLRGSGPFGIVEVFNGGMWGTICDEHFDQEDGDVMCRQLGFTGALHVAPNSYLGVVRDFLHITNITCAGSEPHLWDCPFDNSTVVKCNSNSQVAVHCGSNSSMLYGALRLTGGNGSMGRLEINLDDNWGSVCSQHFGMRDGHVACRQLGFKGVIGISNGNESWTNTANHTVFLTELDCQGYEDSLIHCRHDFGDNVCTYNEDVLLSCDDGEPEPDGKLRLVDGDGPKSGRLEIFKNGLWGTVCSVNFDKADADVTCKQMGYSHSIQILNNFGGGSKLPINLHEINCHGNESRLIDCEYEVYNDIYCHHSQNVAIACDVYCHPLPGIDNGNIICDILGDDGVHSYPDTCNVTCSVGYVLIGSDSRMCLSDGSWSGTDSSCQVYCQSIPDIDNGTVTCSQANNGIHSYQDVCNFKCNSEYTLNGSASRMCLHNGSWSGMDAICVRSKDTTPNTLTPTATTIAVSGNDNDIRITAGIIATILLLLIGIPTLIILIYYIKRRSTIPHQKFVNEKDHRISYDAEEATVSTDNLTNEKH